MGMLFQGTWTDEDLNMTSESGTFQRPRSTFGSEIGTTEYPAERDRYHLFTAPTCPWAHRTLIARRLKQLEPVISSTESDQSKHQGWTFSQGIDDLQPVDGRLYLHQVYTAADPSFTGRVTVPVLWDRKTRTIVNNESSEILRMMNTAFEGICESSIDLYPCNRQVEIDIVNSDLYQTLNNGVYRCGFATSQDAYDAAFEDLFAALDRFEQKLSRNRYLVGDKITESDIRFFTTLVRFDAVYHYHFKCNRERISDYPNLSNYLRDLFQTPGFGDTVDMPRIKAGYFAERRHVNPSGVIPRGPRLDFTAPHNRADLFKCA